MKEVFTIAEAARYAGVDVGNVNRWTLTGMSVNATRGRGDAIRFYLRASGNPKRIRKVDLDTFLSMRDKKAGRVAVTGGVIVTNGQGNTKIGRAATTIVAKQSCPADCRFRDAGCYADYDNTLLHWTRATKGGEQLTPLELARNEAAAIDALPADRDMRLHVAGDSTTEEGTRLIAGACKRYTERGRRPVRAPNGKGTGWQWKREDGAMTGVSVWGYTHAWRTVPREAWGSVSILASCETAEDVRAAWKRGYAAAITAPLFRTFRAHHYLGVKTVPCPAQTHGNITCVECRLCFDDKRLLDRKLVIGFETHGSGRDYADEVLGRLSLPVASA